MELTTILEIVMWGGFSGVIILMLWSLIHVVVSMANLMNETGQRVSKSS